MAIPGNTGHKRLINACLCSAKGLRTCFRTEEAFRQEILLCLILIPLSFFIAATIVEWLLLIGSLLLVLIVELLNTGIERVVDRISTDYHDLSGEAKDMGSAAVFVSLILCVLCWAAIILF